MVNEFAETAEDNGHAEPVLEDLFDGPERAANESEERNEVISPVQEACDRIHVLEYAT